MSAMVAEGIQDRRGCTVPEGLMEALTRAERSRQYSSIVHLFFLIYLGDQKWCGVAGDGDNGCYEHFIWAKGKLTMTDVGYGCTDTALRDVLNQEVPL